MGARSKPGGGGQTVSCSGHWLWEAGAWKPPRHHQVSSRRAEEGLGGERGFYQGMMSHGPTAFDGVPASRQYGGEMEEAAVTLDDGATGWSGPRISLMKRIRISGSRHWLVAAVRLV